MDDEPVSAAALIGSAALTAGASSASSAFGAGQSQGSARRSRKFTREVMQNQRQWLAEDLRKAGINPMLASGASPTGHGSGGQTITASDPKIDLASTAQALQSFKNQKEQNRSIKAQADLDESNSALDIDINRELRKPENIGAYIRSKILGTGSTATVANLISSIGDAFTGRNKNWDTDNPGNHGIKPPASGEKRSRSNTRKNK